MRLLVIFGPPAVGKMTVGREVARRSCFRLFHNHATIEPLLDVFDYGTPAFKTLLDEFRIRVVEEAARSGTDLLLTFVWGLDLVEDAETVQRYIGPYVEAGGEVAFVELYADLATRLERNRTEHRLAEKKSKRNVEWSDVNVRELERHVLNTRTGSETPADQVLARHRHLRLDNTDLSPGQAAERILTWLGG
ncbi:MAG: AAA family ATPase [Actinomycetota bacterium]|nr:AAA family ATPase [Actinomycetota bacterium]